MESEKNRRLIYSVLGVVCGIVVILGAMKLFLGVTCPMKFLIGLPCPGCGLSRAFELLLRGKVEQSFRMHPFLIPYLLMFVMEMFFRTKHEKYAILKNGYIVLVVVTSLIFYCWRMKHFFPKQEPMTYYENNLISKLRLLR